MSEDIWKKSLGIENNPSYKERSLEYYNLKVERINLRNYINVHTTDEINVQTLYKWFGEYFFNKIDTKGLFIQHLACSVREIPFEKRYKLLEEIFKVTSPNIGNYREINYNYFQYCLLVSRLPGINYTSDELLKLYELGIKNGMNEYYIDSYRQLISHYFVAICPYNIINDLFDVFLTPNKNVNNEAIWTPIEILERRVNLDDYSILKRAILNICNELENIYNSYPNILKCDANDYSEENKIRKKIINYKKQGK